MKKLLIFIVALFLMWFLLPQQKLTSSNANTFEELVSSLMEEAAIPAMAIAKIKKGDVDYLSSFGLANVKESKEATVNTLFNIASISKPIMGVVLLKLVEEQKLDLDKNINNYLSFQVKNPNFPESIITVRQLATHTSGIADYYDINSFTANKDSSISLKQHLMSFLTPEGENYNSGKYYLKTKPGEARKYSNLAAGLAGQLVEAVTGKSLAEYSKEHVFPMLGMENSSWTLQDIDLNDIATPYEVEQCIPIINICANTEEMELNYIIAELFNPPYENKSFIPYPHFGNPQYPDGGVRTSVKQLSQFMALILKNETVTGERLMPISLHNEMFTLQLDPVISDSQRFFWRDKAGLTGHMGSDLGVFTAMYFDVKSQSGFIILMNRGYDAKAETAANKIAEYLMNHKNRLK